MPRKTKKDFPAAAARVERKLDRLGISKAEAGRILGLKGNYGRVRVSKVLTAKETSWKLLDRIEREVIAPAKAAAAEAA